MSEQRGGRQQGSQQGGGGGLPAAPQRTPGYPSNPLEYQLNEFRTLNRQVSRAAIGDEEMAWCHNLAPIAANYLRTMPDNSPAIYTVPDDLLIWTFDFLVTVENLGYSLIFLSDGSAQQVQLAPPHNVVQVAPAGTFSTVIEQTAMIQAGLNSATVAVIVSSQVGATDPDDGFFIWDGQSLYQAGTISPVTTITDGGQDYTSAPSVSIFGGSGTGASAIAEIAFGSVIQVKATAPGHGYLPTDSAILVFGGGGQGNSAYGLGVTSNGVITSITIVSGGSGFTSVPTIVITPVAGGSGAVAVVTGIQSGVITSIEVLGGGGGYGAGATVTTSGGGGSGAVLVPVIENGVITSVNMISTGSGYSSPPQINYVSTSGSGASGRVLLVNGQIQGVAFDNASQGGSGYQTPPIVQFIGGGGPASGLISLMPFGVKGTDIETFVGRIWIIDGNRIFFTAPESLVDFGNGGGVFQDTDSFQRYTYVKLKQSNGFLYLVSDSSVNYISGVTTSGTPPITTFTNLNIDPQIGCTWRPSCTVFSRQIFFGNTKGVYAITGGAVQKQSPALDLEFYTPVGGPPFVLPGGYQPSSAVAQIFATDIFMFLMPALDPTTGSIVTTFFCWNGKRWWTANQTANIQSIATFEANSQLIAYGHDTTHLYPLFQLHTTNLQRILQSKLWIHPSFITEKKAWAIFALFECYGATTIDFEIDTETGTFEVAQGQFEGNGSESAPSIVFARSTSPTPGGQTIGFTMRSTSADFALLTAMLVAMDYSLRT